MNDPSFSSPLVFEHLVQVNDSRDPRLQQLSRGQLWRGTDGSWERELDFGPFRVRDRVDFKSEESIRYQVLESGVATQATLTMRIEEPAPGELFVRFIYSVQSPDHDAQSPLAGFLRDAYRYADEDTIGGIRMLAASGLLDQ